MKLHELLAVETSLKTQADKCRAELSSTFDKKRHLFEEKQIVFTPKEEGAPPVVESQSSIQSTVKKELDWIQGFLVKSLDSSYQVAEANTVARADIVLEDDNDTVLVPGVPATSLLELEKKLVEIQSLVSQIPTLDPTKGFVPDSAKGEGFFQARQVNKQRTKKIKEVLIRYEATKEHPAQTELVDKDVVIGTLQEQEWSGLITPAKKAEYINRVEMLTRAVRRARSRANDTAVDKSKKIGKKLLDFIFA